MNLIAFLATLVLSIPTKDLPELSKRGNTHLKPKIPRKLKSLGRKKKANATKTTSSVISTSTLAPLLPKPKPPTITRRSKPTPKLAFIKEEPKPVLVDRMSDDDDSSSIDSTKVQVSPSWLQYPANSSDWDALAEAGYYVGRNAPTGGSSHSSSGPSEYQEGVPILDEFGNYIKYNTEDEGVFDFDDFEADLPKEVKPKHSNNNSPDSGKSSNSGRKDSTATKYYSSDQIHSNSGQNSAAQNQLNLMSSDNSIASDSSSGSRGSQDSRNTLPAAAKKGLQRSPTQLQMYPSGRDPI